MAKSPELQTPPAPGAIKGVLPATQQPQLCTLVTAAPDGADWLSEVKFDGYRIIASINSGRVRLLTRRGHDWADRLPSVAEAFAKLNATTAMIDGELVALRPDGISNFSDLQNSLSGGADHKLHFYAFDLLHLNGWDLRPCALIDRKAALEKISDWKGMIQFSSHHVGQAAEMHRSACTMNLEGIICKRPAAPYRAGRGSSWVKVKCGQREEMIVVGWTPPAGSRIGLGALHLAYFDPTGLLQYAGGVGTGFNDRELGRVRKLLDAIAAPAPPVGMVYSGDPIDRSMHWVDPVLIAEIKYAAWSGSGRVRHSVYLGMREDKTADQVVRPVADPEAKRKVFVPRRVIGTAADAPPRPQRPKFAVPPKRQRSGMI
jgi:bifunctional non-homologous end joining protein LigD